MVYLLPLLLMLLIGGFGFMAGRASAVREPLQATPEHRALQQAVRRRDAFIDSLRELMWRDRDVSPELSTIALDEIRRFTDDPDGWERRYLD